MKRIGKFLIYSRYLILIAVVGCIAITFGAIVMGFGRVVIGFQNHFLKLDFSAKAGKTFESVPDKTPLLTPFASVGGLSPL